MLIVANWKAYVADLKAARALLRAGERVAGDGHDIVLAPPAPMLAYLCDYGHKSVSFSLQDVSEVSGGAATGEVTAPIAQASGAAYTIAGHSERRAQGEDDALIARKVQAALAAGLTSILCIGERERDAEAEYLGFIRSQIDAVFSVLQPQERAHMVLAYEPVWAIGKSGQEAIAPADLFEMTRYIRKALEAHMSSTEAAQIRILYGGSVEAGNIAALAQDTGIQGFLVGRASTDVKTFSALVRAIR